MKVRRNSKYAQNEVELAKSLLEQYPDDVIQKDRVAYWLAYLGDYETAREYAVSDSAKEYIEKCETS